MRLKVDYKFYLLGILFAFLWSSASPAAKIGIRYMEPLMLFQIRFILAGLIMLAYLYFSKNWVNPPRTEWKTLAIFGFLNVTLYLSLFVLAMQFVAAGIGSMSTSICPIMIAVLAQIVHKKPIKWVKVLALAIGLAGVSLAVWPLLIQSYASVGGLLLLGFSMLSYSIGTVYFKTQQWSMNRLQINAWQVMIGGILLIPFTLYFHTTPFAWSWEMVASEVWLIIPVSIIAVNLWLRLIAIDTIKASYFMFLCPIFGFMIATFLLNEPFTWHTMVGTVAVLIALFLGTSHEA